jgi:hypothetical protein
MTGTVAALPRYFVVIPLVPLLLIATYVGWKIKGGFDSGKIKGMKTQIDAAERRLLSANE